MTKAQVAEPTRLFLGVRKVEAEAALSIPPESRVTLPRTPEVTTSCRLLPTTTTRLCPPSHPLSQLPEDEVEADPGAALPNPQTPSHTTSASGSIPSRVARGLSQEESVTSTAPGLTIVVPTF